MTGILFIDVCIGLSAVSGGVLVVVKILRMLKKLGDLIDDWNGEPERPGVPGRPGVMSRLSGMEERQQAIEAELHPNHGSSLRDAIDKTVVSLQRLETRFEAHLTYSEKDRPTP